MKDGIILLIACIGGVGAFVALGAAFEWAAQHPGGW